MDAPDSTAVYAHPDTDKGRIFAALEEGRERTWLLAGGFSNQTLAAPVVSFLSPPVWDLGHIANFEELWLVQTLQACKELHAGFNDTYDAFAHPRQERPALHLLDREGVRSYMDEVRAQVRQVLDTVSFDDCPRILKDAFAYWLIVLHEHQHQETLLQTIQLLDPEQYRVPTVRPLPVSTATGLEGWVAVPAGDFAMGAPLTAGVYDNESPEHTVHVPAFEIARYPVTCGQYLAFLEAGGYEEPRFWSKRGRQWLHEESHHAPLNWTKQDGVWHRHNPTGTEPVHKVANEILCHVTYFEAEAYATWNGARLPTEAEWEKAARWDPTTGTVPGRNPWGNAPTHTGLANVDHLAWMPSRAGSHPEGRAPCGAEQMVGDVWEWTSSGFQAYPGFEAFPYPEYSKVFFGGDYRVLRGGSWATRPPCATATFRNWDHPYRRQIFSGFRLARNL